MPRTFATSPGAGGASSTATLAEINTKVDAKIDGELTTLINAEIAAQSGGGGLSFGNGVREIVDTTTNPWGSTFAIADTDQYVVFSSAANTLKTAKFLLPSAATYNHILTLVSMAPNNATASTRLAFFPQLGDLLFGREMFDPAKVYSPSDEYWSSIDGPNVGNALGYMWTGTTSRVLGPWGNFSGHQVSGARTPAPPGTGEYNRTGVTTGTVTRLYVDRSGPLPNWKTLSREQHDGRVS